MASTTLPEDEVLEREARGRSRAGIAAIVAGVLGIGISIALGFVYKDIPRVFLIEALQDVAGLNDPAKGLLRDQLLFYDERAAALIAAAVASSIGYLALAYALTFLFDAARARGSSLPPAVRLAAPFGAIAAAVAQLALQVTVTIRTADFASASEQGTAAAHDALRSDVLVASQFIQLVATFALGLAFVLIGINAMRVGLLTRFMGILAIIVGVTFVVPLDQQGIVRSFWLIAVGFLFLGRWPTGMPPAWVTGRPQPWPTQQEQRETREREQQGKAPAHEGSEAPRSAAPSPATSSKKKRKRRG